MATTAGRFPTTALMMSTPDEIAPQATGEVYRLATVTAGGLLALYGLWRGGTFGLVTAAAGTVLLSRASQARVRPFDGRWHGARGAVTILAEPEELYRHWRGLWMMPSLVSVVSGIEPLPGGQLRLLLHDAGARQLRWDVEIEIELPGELIRWKATPESEVPGDGEIRFRPAPGGRGTELHVRLLLGPPAGFVGAVAAGLVGRSGEPGRALSDDLRRFKQRHEAGEVATTLGQSRGAGRRQLARMTRRVLPKSLLAEPVEVPVRRPAVKEAP